MGKNRRRKTGGLLNIREVRRILQYLERRSLDRPSDIKRDRRRRNRVLRARDYERPRRDAG
jgi:hypothetical protein